MRIQYVILIVLIVIVSGCSVQTGIAPVETVIPTNSDRDFGFVGTWIPVGTSDFPNDATTSLMEIVRNEDSYIASSVDTLGNSTDALTVDFRTHEISKDHPHAIVEIEMKNEDEIAFRRLAIAAVKDDSLFVWMIDGRKIGELLYDDGVAAVIEHFSFSTTVRCDSEKLLESLSKHSGNIVGTAQVFKRKPEIGR